MANCRSIHRWSFVSLVGSFLDLGLAYFFLCAASLVFVASKFLSFFGLSLPCPCNGLFGHQDRTICVQSALVDQPTAGIESVHRRVRTLSPFEGRPEELVRVGGGNQLRRSDSVFSASVHSIQSNESVIHSRLENSLFLELQRERDELVLSESSSQSDDISDSDSGPDQNTETNPNSTIQTLKSALEKERSARIALTLELEKERNASSSAADEAMAMILRLQKEKSEIEIEARQFKRITEEKSVYDFEEMDVLKEIVVKRELEIFQLERELEMCQTLICGAHLSENKPLEKSLESDEINHPNLNLEVKDGNNKLDEMNELNLSEESKEVTVYDVHVVSDEINKITEIPLVEESKSKGKMSRGKEVDIEKSTRARKKSVRLGPNVSIEKFKLENEVEILRKRLKLIRKEREKLGFGVEESQKEKEMYELKLLEEILRQLKEIKNCAETGQSSLQMVKHTR